MRRRFINNTLKIAYIKNNEIWYTNGSNITQTPLHRTDVFNANIISTVYSAKIKSWVITFDKDITTIGYFAFAYCYAMTSVTIPNSVTSIGEKAFYYCKSLISVNIPDGVTSIGDGAFYYCTKLASVYCKSTTPPTLGSIAFSGNASDRKIYVPMESVDAYKAATNWSSYASYIEGYNF